VKDLLVWRTIIMTALLAMVVLLAIVTVIREHKGRR
jgi:cell division protein FtsL